MLNNIFTCRFWDNVEEYGRA